MPDIGAAAGHGLCSNRSPGRRGIAAYHSRRSRLRKHRCQSGGIRHHGRKRNVATEGANDTNYNVKWDGETLTLRDATVKVVENEHSAAIERSAPFTLKLEGRNTLTSLENTHAGKGISATIEDYETVDPTVPYALTICGTAVSMSLAIWQG